MRIHIGSDHAGFRLKEHVREHLVDLGHDVVDVGTFDEESVDYPDFAIGVARGVAAGVAERGILVCGSGLGMAIAANKVRGVRAIQATDAEMARVSRLHNDSNVLTLAGRYTEPASALEIADVFLKTEFEGGRHQRRVEKVGAIESSSDTDEE